MTSIEHAQEATVRAAAAASVATKATYGGAGGAALAWFFSSEAAFLFSVTIGLAGLAVNWYYRAQDNRRAAAADARAQAEHELRMAAARSPKDAEV